MVRHVILWTLKNEYSDTEKEGIKQTAKEQLEALYGQIPSLLSISLQTKPLETSNCDMMLECTFDSFKDLKEYAVHPSHVAVADTYIRPYTATRVCMDFKV